MYTDIYIYIFIIETTHPVPTGSSSAAARHGLDHVPPVLDGRFLDSDLCDVLQRVSTTERWLGR